MLGPEIIETQMTISGKYLLQDTTFLKYWGLCGLLRGTLNRLNGFEEQGEGIFLSSKAAGGG